MEELISIDVNQKKWVFD